MNYLVSLTEKWRKEQLWRTALVAALFWGFAVYIDLWVVKLAKVMMGGGRGFVLQSSIFMVEATLGMVSGLCFASHLRNNPMAQGWVSLAGLVVAVAATVLAFVPPDGGWFLMALGILAFFTALMLALLGERPGVVEPETSDEDSPARVNLHDCGAVLLALGWISGFDACAKAIGIMPTAGYRVEIALVGVAGGLVGAFTIGRRPGDFARLAGGMLIRWVYRVEVVNADRVPSMGGALLLPNHVTYLDAFFITAACRRPVRFVMDETFMASRAIRVFVGIFDTVTIRTSQPREAIRITIDALQSGELVCLFPEGQLTRTGALNELRRGFELIAKKAGHPLIPVWCDGAWGSIFSFEGGRFFKKRPRCTPGHLVIAMGQRIQPESADLAVVRQGLMETSAEAIGKRYAARKWATQMPGGRGEMALLFNACLEPVRRQLWANGHQIGQVSGLPWRRSFSILRADPTTSTLFALRATFPKLFGAKVKIRKALDGSRGGPWVGGDDLRSALETAPLKADFVFYDFGQRALEPLVQPRVLHCPCLAVEGRVIAMSLPDPTRPWSDSEPQIGHQPGTWGKLLPGWFLRPAEGGGLRAHGPATGADGLALPAGCFLDANGFLASGPQAEN